MVVCSDKQFINMDAFTQESVLKDMKIELPSSLLKVNCSFVYYCVLISCRCDLLCIFCHSYNIVNVAALSQCYFALTTF